VLKEYAGRVRLVYKDFPLPSHEFAIPAAEAARCAGVQDQYWPYHDRLFANQPRFRRDDFLAYTEGLGIDRARFSRCLDEHAQRAAVEASFAEGRALGVSSTPTFFINGRPLVGAQPVEAFREAIDAALARKGR
jgi:protein-disulfide isomerase